MYCVDTNCRLERSREFEKFCSKNQLDHLKKPKLDHHIHILNIDNLWGDYGGEIKVKYLTKKQRK